MNGTQSNQNRQLHFKSGLIHTGFWQWSRAHNLSSESTLLALFLISQQDGCEVSSFRISIDDIARQLHWSIEATRTALNDLCLSGFCGYQESIVTLRPYIAEIDLLRGLAMDLAAHEPLHNSNYSWVCTLCEAESQKGSRENVVHTAECAWRRAKSIIAMYPTDNEVETTK